MSTITRGDTAIYDIPIRSETGGPQNLTGCTVWVTAKASTDDADADALYQHSIVINGAGTTTSSTGLSVGTGGVTAGVIVQEITPAMSADFPPGEYVFDVQVTLPSGRTYTALTGKERVRADITRTA